MHPNAKDLTGMKFGRLVALRNIGRQDSFRMLWWEAACECGTLVKVRGVSLTNGATRSCGCLHRDVMSIVGTNTKTHGLSKSRTYKIWSGMIQRCSNQKSTGYKYYGALGIKVCDRWQVFANFLEDMGECPPSLTIDRINSGEDYEPGNCRWATIITQARNTSRNRFVTYEGETRCIAEWAEIKGVDRQILTSRLTCGWTMERAIAEPVRKKRRTKIGPTESQNQQL